MIVVPAGITSWVSVRLGILTKVDFLLLFQESTSSTCGVFKSFLLIHTKELKRCKYDSASYRASVVCCMESS